MTKLARETDSKLMYNISNEVARQTADLRESPFNEGNTPVRQANCGISKTREREMVTYGDLDNFKAVSANKKDVEVTMRAIDVLHKQLEALCHLVTMKLKAGLEKDQKCENKHTKANFKVQ